MIDRAAPLADIGMLRRAMQCPRCTHTNPENALFCNNCGTPLTASPLTPFTSSSVSALGDITVGGDVVDRDKIIQNIVYVGQVLNYAGLEGLIPKGEPTVSAEATTNTLESVLDDLQQGHTLSSAAFAGEVLKAMFEQLAPREPFVTVSTRRVLKEAPHYSEETREAGWAIGPLTPKSSRRATSQSVFR